MLDKNKSVIISRFTSETLYEIDSFCKTMGTYRDIFFEIVPTVVLEEIRDNQRLPRFSIDKILTKVFARENSSFNVNMEEDYYNIRL